MGEIVADAVTLVLADHHVLVAEGLGMLLDAEDDLVVLDLAHHTGQAVESAAEHQPAVLVLDADLPTSELTETLAAAKAAASRTKLLVLSGDADPEATAAVLASGAHGCLTKDRSSRQVATTIRQLAAGEQAVAVAAEPRLGGDPSVELRVRTLTPRERETLGLLTIGWSNRRIAEATQLSYLTVRSHVQNLLLKLGVHSQLEAVAFAVEDGIVETRGTLIWQRHSA
jgi:two-component system, NarL family, nitrate/nitrite response regulator NarL